MHWKMHVRFGKGFINKFKYYYNIIFKWFILLFHTVSFISCYKILLDAGTTYNYIYIIILIYYSFVLSYSYDSIINLCLNYKFIKVIFQLKNKIQEVKRYISNGKSAGVYRYTLQRLNVIKSLISFRNNSSLSLIKKNKFMKSSKTPFNFNEWLVGFTDADGCFSVNRDKNNNLRTIFKISQTENNLQVLYYIKRELGVGNVNSKPDKSGMVDYVVYNKDHLIKVIFPIFDEYKLLTSKRWNYLRFKECVILNHKKLIDKSISNIDINILVDTYIKKTLPANYISDAWNSLLSICKKKEIKLNLFSTSKEDLLLEVLHGNKKKELLADNEVYNEIKLIMSRSWLAGFVEGNGSFYLVKKDKNTGRIVHGFGLTQKLDMIIMQGIKVVLHIDGNVKWHKQGFYGLDTTSSKTVLYIIDFFLTDDSTSFFKGIISIDFKIWVNSFRKYKKDYGKLAEIRKKMRGNKNITKWDS